ncbi:hypothetical protein A2Y83_00350 [Candidatus Falkowbacteria bacterium RBG_13_39_14]|uniref:Uncharacterized protein n=1 Tax=Candidatus Falkowbacteria bacterium RBG_13_39_14 TaxID=1797985 RepID=A0A1F5S7V5_9BACT|nr:MAG: hypothetical protein A2Y83_00350 [Candidatus Falkowbacteria bacterium RBG_13_39_14]
MAETLSYRPEEQSPHLQVLREYLKKMDKKTDFGPGDAVLAIDGKFAGKTFAMVSKDGDMSRVALAGHVLDEQIPVSVLWHEDDVRQAMGEIERDMEFYCKDCPDIFN